MWLTPERLRQGLNHTKGFIRNTFHEGRKWAQHIDNFAQVFRRGLSASVPLLQDLGGERLLGSGVRALQTFDGAKKRVQNLDRNLSRIGEAIDS